MTEKKKHIFILVDLFFSFYICYLLIRLVQFSYHFVLLIPFVLTIYVFYKDRCIDLLNERYASKRSKELIDEAVKYIEINKHFDGQSKLNRKIIDVKLIGETIDKR